MTHQSFLAECCTPPLVSAAMSMACHAPQAAIFTSDPVKSGPLIDTLALNVSRVNINAQCQRGPDSFPFTGRKSSALGTLSVTEALKVVSIETVIATKDLPTQKQQFEALALSPECKAVVPNAL